MKLARGIPPVQEGQRRVRRRWGAALLRCAWIGALLSMQLGCGSSALFLVNTLARFGDYRVERGIAYGESPSQRLDVYRPNAAESAPVVVFFYGGSWTNGSRSEYTFAAEALTARGFVAVVPDYRKFPEVRFPDFVEDGARVVAWVRQQGPAIGADPDAVFVMGHSAGAHIAALLALDDEYLGEVGGGADWLRGMIGLAGPYDFNARRPDIQAVFADSPYEKTQPLTYADTARVPLLLLHGEADRTVFKKNTVNLAAAIRRAGGSVATAYYPEIDHVGLLGALSIPMRGSSPVLDDLARFIRERSGR